VFGYPEPVYRLYGHPTDNENFDDYPGMNDADKAEKRAEKRWAFIYDLVA
jgi:hypothetical protein